MVVHKVATDWTGEWSFQLRYLNLPAGPRTKAASPWSLNLREKDLVYFELIGTWIAAQVLLESTPVSGKPRKEPKIPTWVKGKWHPDQLRLFDDF